MFSVSPSNLPMFVLMKAHNRGTSPTRSPTHPSTHPSTYPCNAGDHSRRQGRMAAAALPRKACRSARNLPLLCSGQRCDQQRVLAYCARHRGSVLGSVLLCWGSICGWTSLPRSGNTCTAASVCFWLCSHPNISLVNDIVFRSFLLLESYASMLHACYNVDVASRGLLQLSADSKPCRRCRVPACQHAVLCTHYILTHLPNVEKRFYCPQVFLGFDFHCRLDA